MDTDLIALISNVGFPIAISIYLIIDSKSTAKALEKNTEMLSELKTVIQIHTEIQKKDKEN